MKIITILLLMISSQAQALTARDVLTAGVYTVEQCNQIANISKRTIKAAISGVPITEVINKFTQGARPHIGQIDSYNPGKGASVQQGLDRSETLRDQKIEGDIHVLPGRNDGKVTDGTNWSGDDSGSSQTASVVSLMADGTVNTFGSNFMEVYLKDIRAIYKTVDQIKTKYGQVRPQDRARLNNRVEQKLIKCREMANLEDAEDNDYNE